MNSKKRFLQIGVFSAILLWGLLISDSKSIQNPYLGSKMPTCGEVKEEL